jgi:hypothetical protein
MCTKEEIHPGITDRVWEVSGMNLNHEAFFHAPNTYIFEFIDQHNYSLTLDRNECFGSYQLLDSTHIRIDLPACTKMCCDSEFAIKMTTFLEHIHTYTDYGPMLIFEGDGLLVLKRR